MTNRKILFGYIVQNGQYVLHPEESTTVHRIYSQYLSGLSYQKISDRLNSEQVSYSDADRSWNKHKVKRLLQNSHYTGIPPYPSIIDGDSFAAVQASIRSKAAGKSARKSSLEQILRLLYCPYCGNPLICTAVSNKIACRCPNCCTSTDVTKAQLLRCVDEKHLLCRTAGDISYQPDSSVIKIENEILQNLEQGQPFEKLFSLILEGAAVRYNCCRIANTPSCNFIDDIARIAIGTGGQIDIQLRKTMAADT